MPAKKKNVRKRARDHADQPARGPPNKCTKKAAPNKDESQYIRRSKRLRRAPTEYWKSNQSSESDNESAPKSDESSNVHDSDSDSVQTDKTFEPQIRSRRTGSQRNRAKNKQQPKRSESSNTTRNKRQKNNKIPDRKRREPQKNAAESEEVANDDDDSVSSSEIAASEKEEIEANANLDVSRNRDQNHNVHARSLHRRTDADLLSPHRRQVINQLPPRRSNVAIANRREHNEEDPEGGSNGEVLDLKAIEKVMKESGLIRKSLAEIQKKHSQHCKDLRKSEEKTRAELNESIEVFNNKYNELKKAFEASKKSIFKDVENLKATHEVEQQPGNENEYKVLYETSMKRMKLLNDEIVALQHQQRQKNEENRDLRQKTKRDLVEYEENKRKELAALNGKHKLEINELEFKLKCIQDEYAEYKDNMDGKMKIYENNQNLMMENLKRENAALYTELNQYHQIEKTATPNSAILTPIQQDSVNNSNDSNDTNRDYLTRIRHSPLTEQVRNELISISSAKQLENEIMNLKQEMIGYEKQLSSKKQLIKEFEELLKNDQVVLKKQDKERDALLTKMKNMKKIINVYSILTSTKIQEKVQIMQEDERGGDFSSDEQNQMDIDDERERERYRDKRGKREKYLCRTVNKENGRMLEYSLTLGVNGENDVNENGINNKDKQREQEEDMQIYCDYALISAHNVSEGTARNKRSCLFEENMTFFSDEAPLWMKGLLQEMFVNIQ